MDAFERGTPRAVHPGDELRRVLTTAREARAARAATLQGIEEVGFKEELRFEVVYDVACGIGKLAQRELQVLALTLTRAPVLALTLTRAQGLALTLTRARSSP